MIPAFEPAPWTVGGQRQTLLGHWCRRRLTWSPPTEDILVDGEPDVRLLLRASWQPGDREERPAVVIVHGLGGSDGSGYTLATGALAWEMGWHVVRMNMRGAGDSVRHCARLYNAGLAGDLIAVLQAVCRQVPRVLLVGFSLGGNLALLTLGREARSIPSSVVAAAAVSPPLDLSACATALERPGNRLYQVYFMRALRRGYGERLLARPDLFEPGRERGLRTVREYDERITAFYGGYASAADYYARASAGPWLGGIERPTLILAARDDPMIPCESVERWPLPASGLVTRNLAPSGGHVGFVAPTKAPGRFWAAQRVLSWLAEKLDASGTPGAPGRGSGARRPGGGRACRRSPLPDPCAPHRFPGRGRRPISPPPSRRETDPCCLGRLIRFGPSAKTGSKALELVRIQTLCDLGLDPRDCPAARSSSTTLRELRRSDRNVRQAGLTRPIRDALNDLRGPMASCVNLGLTEAALGARTGRPTEQPTD